MSTVENPHAGQGMVVLDIGGDIGALVVSAPAEMIGVEIEICPAGQRRSMPDEGGDWWQGDWRSHTHAHVDQGDTHHPADMTPAWPHVAVLRRPVTDGSVAAAVFPGLRAGDYELWRRPNHATEITVHVPGGSVAAAEWPDSS